MEKLYPQNVSRRMRAQRSASSGGNPGELDRATVVTTIRRFGFLLGKAHEVIMGNLIRSGSHDLAEQLNDTLKPLVDLLVHFELEDEARHTDEDDNG